MVISKINKTHYKIDNNYIIIIKIFKIITFNHQIIKYINKNNFIIKITIWIKKGKNKINSKINKNNCLIKINNKNNNLILFKNSNKYNTKIHLIIIDQFKTINKIK